MERVFSLPFTAIIFILVNVVIALANFVLPRVLNNANMSVAAITILSDEKFVSLNGLTAANIYDLTRYTEAGALFAQNKACREQVWPNRTVSASCVRPLMEALSGIVDWSKNVRQEMLDALSDIESYNREQIADVFLNSGHIFFEREGQQVFFNLLATDTLLNPELAEGIKTAFRESAFGIVYANFSYIADFERLISSLKSFDEEASSTGLVVLRVAVQNSGYGDGIVYPTALLKIAGAEVRLIQVAAQDITRGDANSRTLHKIIPSRQIVESLFIVDRLMTNSQSNQILDELISRRNPTQYTLELIGSSGNFSHVGDWRDTPAPILNIFQGS